MANRGPNVEDTGSNSVKIPSNELFNIVVECDKFNVDKIYDIRKDKVNKLSVQRLPVVIGNAYAITRDIDGRREELFRALNINSVDDKSNFIFNNCGPITRAPIRPDYLSMNSNESSDQNELPTSNGKLSVSGEGQLDGEASSEHSDGAKSSENLGLVKSILGPSFEDAVLRTLEFGKLLILKNESPGGGSKGRATEKKFELKKRKSWFHRRGSEEGVKVEKRSSRRDMKEQRSARKRIVFSAKNERPGMLSKKEVGPPYTRPLNVAKIRSLDSELKQVSPSPEKIKRQLEALIQINKDEPPERISTWGLFYPKDYKPHVEFTVMPTTVRQTCCPLSKEQDCNCGPRCTGTGTCCEGNKQTNGNDDCDDMSLSKMKGNCDTSNVKVDECDDPCSSKLKTSTADDRSIRSSNRSARQAPEYISNALGPTLDVSIMDNLKLMRNLFKCDRSEPDERGEPQPGTMDDECSKDGEDEAATLKRIENLRRRVDELTEKQMKLMKCIEQEEQEREVKRKAFEEEEKRMRTVKTSLQGLAEEERVRESHKRQSITECRDYEQKLEALKCRIRREESRLNSLKELSDSFEMEINEAKQKKENLKKNKSLLDAWDVIASKPCHTRLPSFSKVQCLERKSLRPKDNQHCCFPQNASDSKGPEDCKAAASATNAQKGCRNSRSKSLDCKPVKSCYGKSDSDHVAYPIQRDITCGMHRIVKTCFCKDPSAKEKDSASWSSDDDLRKSCKKGPPLQRSKSETGRREQNCTKLCKVLWAVTRINIFQDNSRTYEVMDATTVPPKCPPVKTEGVFVVKNPKKCCPEPERKGLSKKC